MILQLAVTGGSDYKVVLTGSDGTVDNVTFEAGTGIVLADQGSNTVQVLALVLEPSTTVQ